MRLVTNPGSNLPPEAIERYRVHVLPQKIVVDGVEHDTRDGATQADVDAWIRSAREHPHILGTSAREFVEVFRKLTKEDREILAIQTSRKLIGSHAAAVSAGRSLVALADYQDVEVEVIDTLSTDLGTGLCTILAGEAVRANRSLGQIAGLLRRFAEQGVLFLTLETLDNLVKTGRASFLRAWLASLLNVTPIISFVDGELAAGDRISRAADKPAAIAAAVVKKLGARRRVWCGVAHGASPDKAAHLLALLQEKLDVAFAVQRPFCASIYAGVGKGALGAFVYPVDRLPWTPTTPAPW